MAFKYEKDDQNIVTLIMDMPGRSANVINEKYSSSNNNVFKKEGMPLSPGLFNVPSRGPSPTPGFGSLS